ncbi:MAG TPA: hypothetical protein VG476_02460 [Acidimicrobiales bacterium]|nr:hypothetical protein [Acidimicrobiales bacterium]
MAGHVRGTTMPDLAELRGNGDTIDLDDGRTLRLRFERDDLDPFREFEESYGQVTHETSTRVNDFGYHVRPDGFGGRSRKVTVLGDTYWWNPPDDMPDDQIEQGKQTVRDLIEFGLCGVILEVIDPKDYLTDSESLWALEPSPDGDYLLDIVGDLWGEIVGRQFPIMSCPELRALAEYSRG